MSKNWSNHILIVDDRPENLLVLESILEDLDCTITKATSGNEALGLMLNHNFALVLLDVQMPEMDGFETAELMRGNKKTRYIPIIFVTAISKEQNCIFKGYEIGAVDYLFKPIEPIILKSKVKVFLELNEQKKLLEVQAKSLEAKIKELVELKDTNYKLENISLNDGLTGIANRRNLDQYLNMCWKNAIRLKTSLSLIILDIDYFKTFNDNYGHLKGDECIIKVANSITETIKRPLDLVARYGGDEFMVILPETGIIWATVIAEQIRINVEELSLIHEYSLVKKVVTISLGVATLKPKGADSLADLIDAADKALYLAKELGRNRVGN